MYVQVHKIHIGIEHDLFSFFIFMVVASVACRMSHIKILYPFTSIYYLIYLIQSIMYVHMYQATGVVRCAQCGTTQGPLPPRQSSPFPPSPSIPPPNTNGQNNPTDPPLGVVQHECHPRHKAHDLASKLHERRPPGSLRCPRHVLTIPIVLDAVGTVHTSMDCGSFPNPNHASQWTIGFRFSKLRPCVGTRSPIVQCKTCWVGVLGRDTRGATAKVRRCTATKMSGRRNPIPRTKPRHCGRTRVGGSNGNE